MSETNNTQTEDNVLSQAQFMLESATNEYTLSLMKIEKELEMKRYVFENTYDDQDEINRLYLEAEEKAKQDKRNILQKILDVITDFFKTIKDIITGKRKSIDKNATYTNGQLTEADLNKAIEIYEQQEILYTKAQRALDSGKIKEAKQYYDEAQALSENPDTQKFLKKTTKEFKKVSKYAKGATIVGAVAVTGATLIDLIEKMEGLARTFTKVTTTIAKLNASDDDLSKKNIKDKDDLLAMQNASPGIMKLFTNNLNKVRIMMRPVDQRASFAASLTNKQIRKAQAKKQMSNTYAASVKMQSDIATGRMKDGTEALPLWPDSTLTLVEFLRAYFSGAMPGDINSLMQKYAYWTFPKFKDGEDYNSAIIHPDGVYKAPDIISSRLDTHIMHNMEKDLDRRIKKIARQAGKKVKKISIDDYSVLFDVWGLFSRQKINDDSKSPYQRYCGYQEHLFDYYKRNYPGDKRSLMQMWKDAFSGKYRSGINKSFSIEDGTTTEINEKVYRQWMYVYTKTGYNAAIAAGEKKAQDIALHFGVMSATSIPTWLFREKENNKLETDLKSVEEYKGGAEVTDPKTGKKSTSYDFAIKQLFNDQSKHEKDTFSDLGEGGNLYRWKKDDWNALSPGGMSTIKHVIGNKNPVIVDCATEDIPRLKLT